MKLTFIGAAHEVTGSCHFLQAAGKNILIDCGMEQGPDLYENPGLPIPEQEIDYVFLTHAHIDHSGMLPRLVKRGFKGQIFATFATTDLCNIMLRDSAHIQEFEAEWRNRKGKRAGKPEYEPVYTMQDALDAIELLVPCQYRERIRICDGIQIRFTDVGHLLGSASIEVWASEGGVTKKLVFSGDVGNLDQPILKNNNAVLAFSEAWAHLPKKTNCIHCGRCVNACPLGLAAKDIVKAYEKGDVEQLQELNADLCMSCGTCSFVCPAKRPLAPSIALAKILMKNGGKK